MKKIICFISFLCFTIVGAAQTPTVAASNIIFGNNYCSEVNVTWTNGNGASRLVIVSQGAAMTTFPTNDVFYLSGANYGAGHQFSATEYVVYNGTGSSVTVTNLEKNTTYYVSVFEYNGSGTIFNYRNIGYPEASITTENIAADFVIDDPYQCENGNVFNFSPSVVRTGTGTLSYSWRFGDGSTSDIQFPSHTYLNKNIYDVELTVSSLQCESIIVKQDTVAPKPDVSFILDPSIADNTQEQCFLKPDGSDNFFKFTNTSDYGFLATGFSFTEKKWDFGDGSIEYNTDDNFVDKTYSAPGDYTVRFTVDNSFNDIEYCTDSFEIIVRVRPRPIDTNLVFFDTAMCLLNNKFDFDHQTTDVSVASTWDFGDGATGSGNAVSHSYALEGKYYITLEALDGSGCYDIHKDSIVVVPQPNNKIASLDPSYCVGDPTVSIRAVISGGDWLGDGIDTSGIFTPTKLGLNEVRYAVAIGGCRDTASLTTSVYARPLFELGADTTICEGVSFEKSIVKGSATVEWSTGSTDSFTQVKSDGILWAELTETGCSFRDSIAVGILPSPVFNLGSDSTLCGGSLIEIDVTTPEAIYVWSDGFVGPIRVLSASGAYGVTVTNKCGTFTDNVDLNFLPFACDIFVPNAFSPNGDGLNDIFRPTGNVILKSMNIFNRWGEMLHESTPENFGWDGIYQKDRVKSDHYFFIIRYEKPVSSGIELLEVSGSVFLIR